MQGYIIANDDVELTDGSYAKLICITDVSNLDADITVFTDTNRVHLNASFNNMYLVDFDENNINEKYVGSITIDKVIVLRKITNKEIISFISDPRDVLSFVRAYPEYRFKLINYINLPYIAVQYVKAFPETKNKIRPFLFGDNVAPYMILEWIAMFPSDRKLFIHKVDKFSFAFQWAKRFPEDRTKLLRIILSKNLETPRNMDTWKARFSKA